MFMITNARVSSKIVGGLIRFSSVFFTTAANAPSSRLSSLGVNWDSSCVVEHEELLRSHLIARRAPPDVLVRIRNLRRSVGSCRQIITKFF